MLPPIMPVSRLTGAVPFLCRSPLFALFLMILLFPLLLGACAGGGGGLSSAGPVVLVDGTDRFADEEEEDDEDDEDDKDGESPPTPRADPSEEWVGGTPTLIERAFLTAMNEASADATFGASDSFDKIDYRLALNVTRFAYVPGGEAMVDFDATVNTSDGDVLLARSYWGWAPLVGEVPAEGFNALGVALGEAMTVFAGELATARYWKDKTS